MWGQRDGAAALLGALERGSSQSGPISVHPTSTVKVHFPLQDAAHYVIVPCSGDLRAKVVTVHSELSVLCMKGESSNC